MIFILARSIQNILNSLKVAQFSYFLVRPHSWLVLVLSDDIKPNEVTGQDNSTAVQRVRWWGSWGEHGGGLAGAPHANHHLTTIHTAATLHRIHTGDRGGNHRVIAYSWKRSTVRVSAETTQTLWKGAGVLWTCCWCVVSCIVMCQHEVTVSDLWCPLWQYEC